MQKARSRWAALRGIAVGIGKQNSPGCQRVQIRSFTLRVPAHCADPVVQVVHNDKYDIWLREVLGLNDGYRKAKKQEGERSDGFHFFVFFGWVGDV